MPEPLFARPVPAFHADGITLYSGDCLTTMPFLTSPVDAVIADLPYATTRNSWDRLIDPKMLWHEVHALARPEAAMVLFGTGRFLARMIMSNEAEFRYDLVWDKQAVSGYLSSKRQPLRAHESLAVFYRRQPAYTPQMEFTGRRSHPRKGGERLVNHYGAHPDVATRADDNGWQFPRSILRVKRPKLERGRGHPTQKPVELLRWLIRSYTAPGALILDPVAGSGSTLIAARAEGRRAIGIEVHEPYVEMAAERLASGSDGDRW